MSSYEPDHEFVSNYSEDSAMPSHEPQPQHEHGRNYYYNDPKHSEIVTEDEPTLMDCELRIQNFFFSLVLLNQVIIMRS